MDLNSLIISAERNFFLIDVFILKLTNELMLTSNIKDFWVQLIQEDNVINIIKLAQWKHKF